MNNFAYFGEEQLSHRYVTVGPQVIMQVTASIPLGHFFVPCKLSDIDLKQILHCEPKSGR